MASKSDNESGKATSTLREEKVDSGVTFWTHPQVSSVYGQ